MTMLTRQDTDPATFHFFVIEIAFLIYSLFWHKFTKIFNYKIYFTVFTIFYQYIRHFVPNTLQKAHHSSYLYAS